jgi:glycosyltransferase involved in cell wall biosynthesis
VLARPDSLQAQAGFPTKLGEYLATGRPVVVTRTGEIGSYLVDGKSAYLAEPGNVKDIARQIDAVLSNPDAARVVGEAGRKVSIECFDWRVHKDELVRWMKQFT